MGVVQGGGCVWRGGGNFGGGGGEEKGIGLWGRGFWIHFC